MVKKETGRAYEKVIDYIKKKIMGGDLRQGEKLLPERELAEKLGISRNSVREALRTLENIGIITSTQGAGNSISCNFEKSLGEALSMLFLMQKVDYRQLSELRYGLEEAAIALAVDKITPEQLQQLTEIVRGMEADESEELNVTLDKQLHYTIALAADNQLIVSILQVLSDVMNLFIKDLRQGIFKRDKGANKLQQAHKDKVECLKSGEKARAREAVAEHFRLIDESLQATLTEYDK